MKFIKLPLLILLLCQQSGCWTFNKSLFTKEDYVDPFSVKDYVYFARQNQTSAQLATRLEDNRYIPGYHNGDYIAFISLDHTSDSGANYYLAEWQKYAPQVHYFISFVKDKSFLYECDLPPLQKSIRLKEDLLQYAVSKIKDIDHSDCSLLAFKVQPQFINTK